MKKIVWFVLWVFICSFMGGAAMEATAAEVERITTQALDKMLSDPDVVVVDVRASRDWKRSDMKIKGAVREDPGNVSSWLAKYPSNKTLVFYCA